MKKSSLLKRKKHTDGEIHEKIIVIRCFETKQKSSSIIYKTKQKGKVFNPELLKSSSFTITDKVT